MKSKNFVLFLFVLFLSENSVFGMFLDPDSRRSSFSSNAGDDEFLPRMPFRARSPQRLLVDPEYFKERQKNNCFNKEKKKKPLDSDVKSLVELSDVERGFGGILFIDMRNFTSFCKRYKDKEFYFTYGSINELVSLGTFLDYYHTLIRLIIERHGGVVQNTMGDGVFGYFSEEECGRKEACGRSVKCAVKIVQELRLFKTREKGKKKWEDIEAGYGMHCGFFDMVIRDGVKIVDVGSDLNIGSRSESMTKYRWQFKNGPVRLPILVTLEFYEELESQLKELFGYNVDPKMKGLDFCELRGCTYSDIDRTWQNGTVASVSVEKKKPAVPGEFKKKNKKKIEIEICEFDEFDEFDGIDGIDGIDNVVLPELCVNGKFVKEGAFNSQRFKYGQFCQNQRKEKQRRLSNCDKEVGANKHEKLELPEFFSCKSMFPKSI
ncbi:MAG: adenylate/guanylate cyclase domain-containing protein [bacterium]